MTGFRTTYIHDRDQWPHLTWDSGVLAPQLARIHFARGELMGQLSLMGFSTQANSMLDTLVQDVTRSSRIEGEVLDDAQVRSSVARRLGLPIAGLPEPARHVEGVVAMTLDATQQYQEPLDAERLYRWHRSLFPHGVDDNLQPLQTGRWRETEMEVVNNNMSRRTVHFEAPSPARVHQEMETFLQWFNKEQDLDPVIKAGLAHIHFLTVHPFEDGNGRIARALTDLLLARADGRRERYYSLSRQIEQRRAEYYRVLEATQRSRTTDVTNWLGFYLDCLTAALTAALASLSRARARHLYFSRFADVALEERAHHVLTRMFEPFEGKLNNKKYRGLTGVSDDTVTRDLKYLVDAGMLIQIGRTKGTYYLLNLSGIPSAGLEPYADTLYWFGEADSSTRPEKS
ncbi:Fic family protein [Deinococcus radiotolerans]|uniref:Fic family protein n=1 Tax=Deinococcus radiotolerans TaxID=1309407 RepID=UPI001663075E|nr:Fic family protein [Deinococcus radiotolerans]